MEWIGQVIGPSHCYEQFNNKILLLIHQLRHVTIRKHVTLFLLQKSEIPSSHLRQHLLIQHSPSSPSPATIGMPLHGACIPQCKSGAKSSPSIPDCPDWSGQRGQGQSPEQSPWASPLSSSTQTPHTEPLKSPDITHPQCNVFSHFGEWPPSSNPLLSTVCSRRHRNEPGDNYNHMENSKTNPFKSPT